MLTKITVIDEHEINAYNKYMVLVTKKNLKSVMNAIVQTSI